MEQDIFYILMAKVIMPLWLAFYILHHVILLFLTSKVSRIAKQNNTEWRFWRSSTEMANFILAPDKLIHADDSGELLNAKRELVKYAKLARKLTLGLMLSTFICTSCKFFLFFVHVAYKSKI
jgi:hypothetical protein